MGRWWSLSPRRIAPRPVRQSRAARAGARSAKFPTFLKHLERPSHASHPAQNPGPGSGGAGLSARVGPGGQAREVQADDCRGRQEPVLLPAAHHRRAVGPFQGRGPAGRDSGLRRRLQGAAGAGGRQRRRGVGCLRAHHQHAGQEPVHRVLRAAGARAADRAGRLHQDHARLQEPGRPQGQEDRRDRARLVHLDDGQLCAGQGRHQAQRGVLHRRGRSQWRHHRRQVGAGGRHCQPRPGHHHAAARQADQGGGRHPHAQGHAGGLRRPHARRRALHAQQVRAGEPQHHAGADQCHGARAALADQGRPVRHRQDRARVLPAG